MGTVTILNGTNTLINSCISAGVNYSWCNKLSPKTYYHHNGAAGVYTLNTKYWFGEGTEYSNSAGAIGTFVASIVISVIGIVLVPVTGGLSLVGAGLAGAGLALSGISIAVEDFVDSLSKYTNVHALKNRKFIAEGQVETELKDGILTYTKVPNITLRELSEEEYHNYINEGGYTEHNSAPLVGSFLTATQLNELKLLNSKVRIFPAVESTACWEIEGDQKPGAPVQLWSRKGEQVEWKLVPAEDNPETKEFFIYNPSLRSYVTSGTNVNDRVLSSRHDWTEQRFHIVKTEDRNCEKCFVFLPAQNAELAIVCSSGNAGNSTKLVMGPTKSVHPLWAQWRVESV